MKRISASSTMPSACFTSNKACEERRGAPFKDKVLEHGRRGEWRGGGQDKQVSLLLGGHEVCPHISDVPLFR